MPCPMLARSPESRKAPRHWMHRNAEVTFAGQHKSIRCVIHDMSDSGARISIDTLLVDLPRLFTLVLLNGGVRRNCSVVWNDDRFVGVKFTSKWFGVVPSKAPNSKLSAKA